MKTIIKNIYLQILFALGFFVTISILLFNCNSLQKNEDKRPESQKVFETKLNNLKNDALFSNKNEIRREQAGKELEDFISAGHKVNDWCGVVISVESSFLNGDGINVNSLLPPESQLNFVTYYLKEPVGIDLATVKIGNIISFSGKIGGSNILTFDGFISSLLSDDIIQIDKPTLGDIKD